jgi:hypothetical protein
MLSRLNQLNHWYKALKSPRWWFRKTKPWSALIWISVRWVVQGDRRKEHQVDLQNRLLKLNFKDIHLFMGDFIRPEFWMM